MRAARRVLLRVVVATLALLRLSLAAENLPEFESLTEEEESAFEGPARLGPEYQANVLSYQKPEAWEYEWLSHENALDLSIGSLDGSHFYMDQRLKLRARLGEWGEFRFTSLDDRDFEKQSIHPILEVIAWPDRRVGISLYGEADHFKRRDDTGVALLLRPQPRHEIRLFNTFVNVTLLKRNDRPDTFLEPDLPYSRGIVGRVHSDPAGRRGEFFEYAFRLDTRTRWYFPEEQYVYDYRKTFASLFFSRPISPRVRLSSRLQFDRKQEAREPSSETSAIPAQDWTTDRFTGTLRTHLSEVGPDSDWVFGLGLGAALRLWRTEQGTARQRDLLPQLWLDLPGFASKAGLDRWSVGLSASFHHSEGPAALLAAGENRDSTELRFTLSYDFVFGERAVLRLQANGDLDEYGSPQSWDGGNGQFIVTF